ncbi:DUF2207 domain-containing protein [Microbacterium gorillae]|uniref:DUF2207 domain-containing protein n=1 Tax=Microbacterium gorillae TaxID=1231063 RepID=UPI0006947C58|nr:DUF2207 domain-containing protein [Microbacterium gorillae]
MRGNRKWRLGAVITAVLALLMFGALPASAVDSPPAAVPEAGAAAVPGDATGVDDFRFTSLDAQYTLGRDADGRATLEVEETFVAAFPDIDQNHGMRRAIPADYQGIPTQVTVQSVTDEAGNARPMEVTDEDGFVVVTSRSPEFLHGEQTFVFHYTMHDVVRAFGDTGDEEFYWDVNGTGWAQPFDSVSASVTFADGVGGALTSGLSCYRGEYGSSDSCPIDGDAGGVTASTTDLGPGGNMTIAVPFRPGTFTVPDMSYLGDPAAPLQLGGLGLGVVGAALAVWFRRRFLRDSPGYPTVIPQYEPPQGMDAPDAAVFRSNRSRVLPSGTLELAVRGAVALIDGRGPNSSGNQTVQLLDPARAGGGSDAALLPALFGDDVHPGARARLGVQDSVMAGSVSALTSGIAEYQKGIGLWRPVPGWVRALPIVVGAIGALAALLAGFAVMSVPGAPRNGVAWAVLGVALVLLIPTILLVVRRPLSERGAQLRDHLEGLRQFIAWAEQDRIAMLQSYTGAERIAINPQDPAQMLKLYEPLLPYAVVFNQEAQWAGLLQTYYERAAVRPTWYVSPYAFDSTSMNTSMASFAATTAPASSGGSWSGSGGSSFSGGSGGGGFSGGGGGGGGGGGV